MTTYYSNHDLAAYSEQLANYDSEQAAWQQTCDLITSAHDQDVAAYDAAHDQWVTNGGVDPTTEQPYPEPVPPADPTYPAEPTAPADPATVYDEREATTIEQITTATGPAIVTPGRIVMSSDGGATAFALSPDELAAQYTPTSEPLPPARER